MLALEINIIPNYIFSIVKWLSQCKSPATFQFSYVSSSLAISYKTEFYNYILIS